MYLTINKYIYYRAFSYFPKDYFYIKDIFHLTNEDIFLYCFASSCIQLASALPSHCSIYLILQAFLT